MRDKDSIYLGEGDETVLKKERWGYNRHEIDKKYLIEIC
jgi:hypothetical protein